MSFVLVLNHMSWVVSCTSARNTNIQKEIFKNYSKHLFGTKLTSTKKTRTGVNVSIHFLKYKIQSTVKVLKVLLWKLLHCIEGLVCQSFVPYLFNALAGEYS